jgi:hypothetical protein
MNERIRELAREAGLPTYNPEGIPTKLEKFAELLIRECAKLADNCPHEYLLQKHKYPSTWVKEHFGVEE